MFHPGCNWHNRIGPWVVLAMLTIQATAQVNFVGTQVVVASQTLARPMGLSADGLGNVYIADTGNGRILSIAVSGSGAAPPVTIVNGLSNPQDVAADWYGNIYVAETGNNRVLKFPVNQGGYGPQSLVCSGLSSPAGVAVDPAGNVYVADSGNNRILEVPNLGSVYGNPQVVASGFSNPMGVAVDAAMNVFVADTGNNRVAKVSFTHGTYAAPVVISRSVVNATAIAVDKYDNMYVTDAAHHQVLKFPWFAAVGYYYPSSAIGGDFPSAEGIALTPAGQVYISDAQKNEVVTLEAASVNFPNLPVGSTASPMQFDYNIAAGTTLGPVAIYSQGLTTGEFADVGDSTCTAQTYTVAALCVVDITFTPAASGLRSGAIVLSDADGNMLATAFVSGTGVEPQAAFYPGIATALGTQLSGPSGVAVDARGNLYIADTGNDRVVELPWNGAGYGPQTTLSLTGVSSPMGLAIDGAGNLYIASSGNDRVIKAIWNGSGFSGQTLVGTGLYGPSSVAVDRAGTAYIADTYDNTLWKVPWTGSTYSRELTFANYTKIPVGVAVAPGGDVFFTMPYINDLAEKPWVAGQYTGQLALPLRGVSFPSAIAIDGNSNLYVVDTANNQVVMLPWTVSGFADQITVASGFNAPSAIAVDAAGNLYVADTGNDAIVKIQVSGNPALSFATTNVGSISSDSPISASMINIGNDPLVISDVSYPVDFSIASSAANSCATGLVLPQASTCSFSIDFEPQSAGSPLAEQIVVTDNELDLPGTQRSILLSGVAVGRAQQSIAFPSMPDVIYGAPAAHLVASASSGLPVTYLVLNGPATLLNNGTGLAFTAVGTVTVQAMQAGNAAYLPATPVIVSFRILPATLTVTPYNATALYGAIPNSFGYAVTGLVNGQSSSQAFTGSAVVTTNAVSSSGVAAYTLTAAPGTLSATNYTFVFNTGQLTVLPATLQISSVSMSIPYGTAFPVLTWTAIGWKNGDTATALQGVPILTTNANIGSPVGIYSISVTAGSLRSPNYTFRFVPGTLTVNPAALVIAASNQGSTYGGVIPLLTWTITGLVQGDSSSVVSGLPAITTTAVAGSPAGTYPISISAGTLTASNYTFQFRNGQLVIQKAPISVTPGSASIVYGQSFPAFTYSLSGFVNQDSQASAITGQPQLTSSAMPASKPGIYTISASAGSLSAHNYSFVFANGNLNIGKALLTVTPRALSVTYGAEIPAIAYDVSGFVYADNTTSIQGAPVFSTNATTSSPVASYAITGAIGSLSSASYLFHVSNGALTISKSVLTVNPVAASMVYGGAMPAFSYVLSGFMNGEGPGVITGLPVLTTTATSTSAAGTYAIAASLGTLSASNYSFTFVPGQLTVSKAQLIVMPNAVSIPYGGVVTQFSYTLTGFVNADSASCVTGKPNLWSSAPSTAVVGIYSIDGNPGTLVAQNYIFTINSGAFTVTKAVLIITANSAAITYGAAAPSFTYAVTGFVHGENVAVLRGQASLSSSFTAASPAGSYPVVAAVGTLAAANYTFQFVNGYLTVNKAPLLVKAADTSMIYGSALPPLTWAITGFVNGDTQSVVSGTAILSSSASPKSNTGTYTISADTRGLSSASYTFQSVSGTLTIAKAQLLVVPDAVAITYGAVVPRLTYTLSGLLNGDSATVVGGSPSLSVNVPSNGPVGSYTISGTPGTLIAMNYSFIVGSGTLTVNKATLTVTALPQTMTYGSAVPALSYKIAGYVHGEGSTVIAGTPELATVCSSSSPAGTLAITVTAGSLSAINYTFQFVNGVLSINKAILVVTPVDTTMTYGSKLPAFTWQATGFVNGDSASVIAGKPLLSSNATSASGVGVYAIQADVSALTASNYLFHSASGLLTVTKAQLLVSPSSEAMTYGGAWPGFSYQVTGFVNGDASSVLSGKAALSTNANNRSSVGRYTWNAASGSLSAANYSFQFGSGTLTVNPAVLTVVAQNLSMTYGASVPTLRYGFQGLVNGDNSSMISGVPVLATSASSISPVGAYFVNAAVGTLAASNYTFTFVKGCITVSKAVLNVLPANLQMLYGTKVPPLTYALAGFVNGDTTASATTGEALLSSLVAANSPVGQYGVTASLGTLAANNYSFAFGTGKITVAPVTLSVTAKNQSMKAGGVVPPLTFTASGFVNGDTIASATSGVPALTTAASASSKAGTYSITIAAGSMTSLNYQLVFKNGILTITQ